MKKIDWDKVWQVMEKRRKGIDYYFMIPTHVRNDIKSLVEAQLKPRKRK